MIEASMLLVESSTDIATNSAINIDTIKSTMPN